MNWLSLIATLLLTAYYFVRFALGKEYKSWAAVGLTLLSCGMFIDNIPLIYPIATCVAAGAAIYGCFSKPP